MLRTVRLRSAHGLSWGTLALNVSNGLLWFVYGIVLGQLPIVCANSLYSLANATLVFFKLRYDADGRSTQSHGVSTTPAPASRMARTRGPAR